MVETNVEKFLIKRAAAPIASGNMATQVSKYRREVLEDEVTSGKFIERGSGGNNYMNSSLDKTGAGNVTSSHSFVRVADTTGNGASTSGGFRGSGGSYRQVPEIYSPLWLNSNLNLPRDRATINAWARAFFALNPFVQNAITLHSTYPISKLNIKSKNEKVQTFFEGMIEETDLINVCIQIAQEYWLLGEAFIYAELDERSAKWGRFIIQNPDYVTVKHSVIAGEPILSLRPDENLKRIVTSNRPADIQQRQQLDQSIIEHVRRGENIPLSNFNASHIARRLNPYDTRGTGLTTSCFRNLMLFDKLRECYSIDTEVLTKDGFKYIKDLVTITNDSAVNPNYVNGTYEQNGELNVLSLKDNIEVACFNQDTGELEYHIPEEFHMSYYQGKMLHFTGNKVDTLVTPNHKMLAAKKSVNKYGAFELIRASEFNDKSLYKFNTHVEWNGKNDDSVEILNKIVPTELYMKFIGYVISAGCIDNKVNEKTGYCKNRVTISQYTQQQCYQSIKQTMLSFAEFTNSHIQQTLKVYDNGSSKSIQKEQWIGTISNKELTNHLVDEIGDGISYHSENKRIPRWVLQLDKKYLMVLLDAIMQGDGTTTKIQQGISYRYSTSSELLANDIQEVAFKCGYTPFISISKRKTHIEHTVRWSDSAQSMEPIVYNDGDYGVSIKEVNYEDVVWCFTVPTGAFITRRNQRVAIHGNSKFAQADGMINPLTLIKIGSEGFRPSPTDLEAYRQVWEEAQYDKDFKIFTHNDVTVERIGYNSGVIDISADIEKLTKEIYIGLMVPQVLMDGGSDVTYANGGVTLDVLKQRYMSFRNLLSGWLRKQIFAPISKINDFYEYKDGQKILVVPEVEWNHMSLFDAGDYIQVLTQLAQGTPEAPAKVSTHTLYRSIGLDWEDEVRKLRIESVQNIIYTKELEALGTMSLNELRTLGPDDTIDTPVDIPVPGEENTGNVPGGPQEGGPDNIDLGGLPGMGGPPGGAPGGAPEGMSGISEGPPPMTNEAPPGGGGPGGNLPIT